jgi:hypothetical protein
MNSSGDTTMGAAPSREAVLRIGNTGPAAWHRASALQVDLANLEEHAVAALGFGHPSCVRSAPATLGARSPQQLQRMSDAMPCHAMPCHCSAVQCSAVQCSAVQCSSAS